MARGGLFFQLSDERRIFGSFTYRKKAQGIYHVHLRPPPPPPTHGVSPLSIDRNMCCRLNAIIRYQYYNTLRERQKSSGQPQVFFNCTTGDIENNYLCTCCLYGAVRNGFEVGNIITRGIGRGGPLKSRLFLALKWQRANLPQRYIMYFIMYLYPLEVHNVFHYEPLGEQRVLVS